MEDKNDLRDLTDHWLALDLEKEKHEAEKALREAKKGILISSLGLVFFFVGFIVFDYYCYTMGWLKSYPFLSGVSFIWVGCWICFLFMLLFSHRKKKEAKERLATLQKVDLY